jgi:hypothetical protein
MALDSALNFTAKLTANYQANSGDFVLANAAITITLPTEATGGEASAPSYGAHVVVKNVDSTTVTVTVKTSDGSTIDGIAGSTGIALAAEYETVDLVSDGANWWVRSGGPATAAI